MTRSPSTDEPGTTGSAPALASAPPPGMPAAILPPDRLELYIRSAMHPDRSPGQVLVVVHPHRMYKVPRGLLARLRDEGFAVTTVETLPDRVASIERIRDALVDLSGRDGPLDLVVVSGDGTMDHHVLVAAFLAFYPDLVKPLPGVFAVTPPTREELAEVPAAIRRAFLEPLPDGAGLEPDEPTVHRFWVLRERIEGAIRKGRSPQRVARLAGLPPTDPLLRLAVLGCLLPHRVEARMHDFDLEGLTRAGGDALYRGLYPFIRSISIYPAGTAADNAVFAGTPGWGYAQLARVLVRVPWLDGLRRWLERRTIDRFVDYFTRSGVVVPERISLVAFDGRWRRISSHAAGGPAAGRFFVRDLVEKTRGMLGYLARIPRVVVLEGFFGSTIVRVESRTEDGRRKSFTESRLAEGLYTNRVFIAGIGTVPTTNPTSFAGQSSLCLVVPIVTRGAGGRTQINLRGIGAFVEAIAKGILARALHMLGLGVGGLAGGGKFVTLLPEHQVAIKEGEEIDIRYMDPRRRPRAVPVQVSGDPFQAWRIQIHSSWAPIPVLGHDRSLLLSTTRAILAAVRLRQSYHLASVYIGGLHYFRHLVGEAWSAELLARTGLLEPPRHLPLPIAFAQARLIEAWKAAGAGEFVDTTKAGLDLGRRGRYAHNNDQTAHLVVLREPHRFLLVRQLRAMPDGSIYENRTRYIATGAAWIIRHSQTIGWLKDQPPLLIQEDHYFRNAEEFQRDAPTFFPMLGGRGPVAGVGADEEAAPPGEAAPGEPAGS